MLLSVSNLALYPDDACARLRTALINTRNRYDALSYLKRQQVRYRLLALYQTLFPDEYAASRQSLHLPVILRGNRADGHSDREIEFLELVDRHLFPVSWIQFESTHTELSESIWLFDAGIDWQGDAGYDALQETWQMLIPFTQCGYSYFVEECLSEYQEWFGQTFGFQPVEFVSPEKLTADRLQQHFETLPEPLCYLPVALKVLDKETGSLWLDENANPNNFGRGYQQYEWTEHNIQILTEEWRKAEAIWQKCEALMIWIKRDMQAAYQQIVEQWNIAYANTNSADSTDRPDLAGTDERPEP